MKIGDIITLRTATVARLDDKTVKKTYTNGHTGWTKEELYQNEISALSLLKNTTGIQNLIEIDEDNLCFFSHYAGIPISNENIDEAKDISNQVERIISHLNDAKLLHRDIMPRNILINNGIITLIDFCWATFRKSIFTQSEKTLPPGLGGIFKPENGFDDLYSIRKSIDEIIV